MGNVFRTLPGQPSPQAPLIAAPATADREGPQEQAPPRAASGTADKEGPQEPAPLRAALETVDLREDDNALDEGSFLEASTKEDPKHPEERLQEWCELIPGKSKLRIIVGFEEMIRLCNEVGNAWSERVHHMNGNVYTVVENLPPKRYKVYDHVCAARGIQGGNILVPYTAVALVLEPQLVLHARLEEPEAGPANVVLTRLSGAEVSVVALEVPDKQDVDWLKGVLSNRLGCDHHLLQLVAGDRVLELEDNVKQVLSTPG